MKIADFDLGENILVVAEIGNNHEGSLALAEEMLGRAVGAGASAVKFQTFRTEHYVSRKDEARFRRLKKFELPYSAFEKLSQAARQAGVLFLSTPFDLQSAESLNDLVPAFKIASGDNDFLPLLEKVAGFGKPILLSGGLADMDQLRRSTAFIEGVWRHKGVQQEMAVLHCVSGYPVPLEQANLGVIPRLREKLGCTVGYSDHTIGTRAAVLAAALGARIIEKHFTIDKNYSDFRDHQLSADPREFAALVAEVKQTVAMLGSGEKAVQDCERANVTAARRSIAAARDLPAGTIVRREDITWVRPGGGIPPGREDLVVGRVARMAVAAGEAFTSDILAEGRMP